MDITKLLKEASMYVGIAIKISKYLPDTDCVLQVCIILRIDF